MRSGPAAAIRSGNALPLINIPVGQAIHNIELRPGAGGQLVRAAGTSAVLVSKSATIIDLALPSRGQTQRDLACKICSCHEPQSGISQASSATTGRHKRHDSHLVRAWCKANTGRSCCSGVSILNVFLSKATEICAGNTGYVTVRLPSGEQRLVLERCMATIGSLSNAQHKNRKLGRAGANRWLGRRPVVRGVAMNSVDHPHGGGRWVNIRLAEGCERLCTGMQTSLFIGLSCNAHLSVTYRVIIRCCRRIPQARMPCAGASQRVASRRRRGASPRRATALGIMCAQIGLSGWLGDDDSLRSTRFGVTTRSCLSAAATSAGCCC